jgi:hypothetical protein
VSAEDIEAVSDFVSSRNAGKLYAHWTWDFYQHLLGDAADVTTRNTGSGQGGTRWLS